MYLKNRKQPSFGAINWLYKWLESDILGLALQPHRDPQLELEKVTADFAT